MTTFWKRSLSGFLLGLSLVTMNPTVAKADLFGGDVAVLTQILMNAVQQLQQLQQLLNTGSQNLALIRDINRGINDSLKMIRTAAPTMNPGLYSEWSRVEGALKGLEGVYGAVVPSKIATMQKDVDRNVAEAVTLNNNMYAYSKDMDQVGEEIKNYSHAVSPGGAQKLTAESLGVMITIMNQNLRAQATGLKLQAQTLAIQNQKDKEYVRYLVDSSQKLSLAMKSQPTKFTLPRF